MLRWGIEQGHAMLDQGGRIGSYLDQEVQAGLLDRFRTGDTNIRMPFVRSDHLEPQRHQVGRAIDARLVKERLISQVGGQGIQLGIGNTKYRDTGIEWLRQRRSDFELPQSHCHGR